MGGSDLGEECKDEESFGRKPRTGGKEISRRGSSFWKTEKVVSKRQDRTKLREYL
jgi:hypothetical protein